MATCPDEIKRLIEHFDVQSDQVRSPDYNETQLRIDFVNPLFKALGWDIDNTNRYAEQYREVVHEDRVKVAGQTKAPDYSFRIGGVRKFFLEAKKPSVNIKLLPEPAYQLRRYGWSAKLAVSLLTDFEEFAIYDCRIAPKNLDKAATARREYITYHEYPEKWDFLVGTFSKDAVLKGEFDRYCNAVKGRGRQEFDDTFLEEIEEWRLKLAQNLALRNDDLDESMLNFSVQRIIDRIIFLRIAEDRGTEITGQLQSLLNGDKTYERLGKLFRDADARYNSGLFHFDIEKGRDESPDTLTPSLTIDDDTLKKIIKRLYYPDSPYEFTVVTADILGSVYERFLGKVISLTAGHRAKLEEKPEVRKAGGVYYTPTYIVDYIVKNTVGKLLEERTAQSSTGVPPVFPKNGRDARSTLKILDPACGSGSFLIGAYQYLLDWHLAQYLATNPAKLATGKNPVLRPGPDGGWRLTIAERKRILLDNIHGVDLDAAAVEVTKLNLLLKCLEGETSTSLGFQQKLFRERALPDLGHNILCGNSLIGTDIMATDAWSELRVEEQRGINPFDYERAFVGAFKQGGFDALIGNPPYIRIQTIQETSPISASTFKSVYGSARSGNYDIYVIFIEKALALLNRSGSLGFILPNKFFTAEYGAAARGLIANGGHLSKVVDFGHQQIFDDATTYTCLLFLQKTRKASVDISHVDNLPEFAKLKSIEHVNIEQIHPDERVWNFDVGENAKLLDHIRAKHQTLGEIAKLFVGLQTDADDVFILSLIREEGERALCRCEADGKEYWLERTHLKPFLKGSLDIRRYILSGDNRRLVFPYKTRDSKSVLISEHDYQHNFPLTWQYLSVHRQRLSARAKGSLAEKWYGYVYKKNHVRFDTPKLLAPAIAKGGCFAYDAVGRYYFVGSGGGGGGGYGIVPNSPSSDVNCLLAILNSRVTNFFLRRTSTSFRGGYIALNKQYIEQIPISETSNNIRDRLASAAKKIQASHELFRAEALPQRRDQIQREIEATDRQIDQLVYELYGLTDDEIRIVEEATR